MLLVATWTGTVKTSTLALVLRAMGYTAEIYDGFLDVRHGEDVRPVEAALEELARSERVSANSVLSGKENLMTEKFHPYLSFDLLIEDATSSRIDLDALQELARGIMETRRESGLSQGLARRH